MVYVEHSRRPANDLADRDSTIGDYLTDIRGWGGGTSEVRRRAGGGLQPVLALPVAWLPAELICSVITM